MENAALQFTNAHIYQRQKEILQDMERARLSSEAFSSKMHELSDLFASSLSRNKTTMDRRVFRRLVNR
jgi:hypothetical protein